MHCSVQKTDIVIIGAGPVGLFAVFEAGLLKMTCHVVDALETVGGQCRALYPEKPIYDIPGHPRIDAQDLIDNLYHQAAPFKPIYHLGQRVTTLAPQTGGRWSLTTSTGTRVEAGAVIIAAGSGAFGPNRPPLSGLEIYENQGPGLGIHYMVTRRDDFRDRRIVIAGGGDSAVDWALSLSEIAQSVKLVHRRPKFRAAPDSVTRLNALHTAGQVELVTPYQLYGLEGQDGHLTGVTVQTLDGHQRTLTADVLLPFYGLSADLGPIADWGLDLSRQQVRVNPTTQATSIEGIFAIGDVCTYTHKLKLILQGFSEAATAAYAIYPRIYPDKALHFQHSTTSGIPV